MSQSTGKDTPQTTAATSNQSQQNIPQATTSPTSAPPQLTEPTSLDQSTTTTTGNHDSTQTETVNQSIAHQSDGDQDDHVEVVSKENFLSYRCQDNDNHLGIQISSATSLPFTSKILKTP